MPSQVEQKSKPGSSRGTAMAVEVVDVSDSDDPPSSARRSMPSRQASRQSRTKATSLTRPAAKATSSKSRVSHNITSHQDISSDSDESSDCPVVATSRTINKGKQRSTDNGSGSGSQTAIKRPSQAKSAPTGRKATSSTMQLDSDATSSSESPPTPDAEPRHLLKADRTPVKKAIVDDQSLPRDARAGPSFLERLHSNATPQFNKQFKGKVRSSVSTSIPLNDDRFASDEGDEDYESDDKPSARRPVPKKAIVPKAFTSAHPIKGLASKLQSQTDDKRLHLQTIEDSSDDDEELPSLPGTSANPLPAVNPKKAERFKENLEQLNQRRRLSDKKSRLKEKQAKRTVASPSPSPEPVTVVASRPASQILSTVSPRTTSNRINVRATSSAGKPRKRPMFRPPSDDSDAEDVTSAFEKSDSVKPMGTAKPGHKDAKGKKRKASASPSSSSASSSAESSAPPDDDELSEVEEDISLDFNPIVRDKLRPKDNSKAHRLDALKRARAVKELKEQKRRKGIIDSDEDDNDKTRNAEVISEDDDNTEVSSSSADVDNFIVPDNGDIDEEELARAARMMPVHLSGHAALTLEDHFHVFITAVVFRFFLPKSKHYQDDEMFKFSQLQVQNAINGLINSSIASSIWREDFRAALDARPELYMKNIPYSEGCEGCDKYDRTASQRAALSGKPYNVDTFEDDGDEDDEPSQEFDLGRFCAEKAQFHHSLRHFLKKAYNEIRHYCRTQSTLGHKLMGDKDDRMERREAEAARIVQILADSDVSLQRQLWIELDQLMERAKHKYLK